jgi:hypothetical protein
MWPLAFSTFGLLNRLKRDILLEFLRSSTGGGLSESIFAALGVACRFCSTRFALDRLRRQREVEKLSFGDMASTARREVRLSTHPRGRRAGIGL